MDVVCKMYIKVLGGTDLPLPTEWVSVFRLFTVLVRILCSKEQGLSHLKGDVSLLKSSRKQRTTLGPIMSGLSTITRRGL